jgi:hypothetical protein
MASPEPALNVFPADDVLRGASGTDCTEVFDQRKDVEGGGGLYERRGAFFYVPFFEAAVELPSSVQILRRFEQGASIGCFDSGVAFW